MDYVLVLAVGLIAGTVSGITGTGASVMLVPVLVLVFGPQQAVPIMAVAAVCLNLGRMAAWWREIDWRAVGAYGVTAVPAAALGAATLLTLPARWVDGALGLFFLVMIPGRRWLAARDLRAGPGHLALAGGPIGFLTGVVVSTGPLSVPLFLAYGLTKGAFLGTEAAASLTIYVGKLAAFRGLGALPLEEALKGLMVGGSLTGGAFVAKRLVRRLDAELFRWLMDGVMLAAGLALLWTAVA